MGMLALDPRVAPSKFPWNLTMKEWISKTCETLKASPQYILLRKAFPYYSISNFCSPFPMLCVLYTSAGAVQLLCLSPPLHFISERIVSSCFSWHLAVFDQCEASVRSWGGIWKRSPWTPSTLFTFGYISSRNCVRSVAVVHLCRVPYTKSTTDWMV